MSTGLNALRAVIDAKSITLFRVLKEEWFVENETEIYQFIRAHVRKYGNLPDLKTIKENGYNLPKVEQPPKYYIDRITERAIYDGVQEAHKDLNLAMRSKSSKDIVLAVQAMVQATRVVGKGQDYTTLTQNAAEIFQEYREAKLRPGIQGITTGYAILDEVTNGLHGGDVLVVAGRPNQGKSYKLLSMMRAAWKAGSTPSVVSMEMTSKQLSRRFLGMEAGINPDMIRRAELSSIIGEPKLVATIDSLKNYPAIRFMEGKFRKSVQDVSNMVAEYDPNILYIDAGYLLTPEVTNRNFSKHEYNAAVMEEIKCLAEDRNIPVVMTVQLNREARKNSKKGLDLTHLAGTDAIAQIATMVIGMLPGKVPYEDTRREYQLIKNREGALISYQGNFMFNPMNFDYVPGSEATPSSNEVSDQEYEQTQQELSAMEDAGWTR